MGRLIGWMSIWLLAGVDTPVPERPRAPSSSHASYEQVLAAISTTNTTLQRRYERAASDSARTAVLEEAGEHLTHCVRKDVTPFWLGTPWRFEGTTEVPGTGEIACGYFVTTVLRDVGVALDRVRLAQQASEAMIRNLVDTDSIRRFRNVPIESFEEAVREWGKGLYVVGLDNHVGFIVHDESGIHFIHSSYVEPLCVVDEQAVDSVILKNSRYRVLGKLTTDRRFLLSWLSTRSTQRRGER